MPFLEKNDERGNERLCEAMTPTDARLQEIVTRALLLSGGRPPSVKPLT